MALTRSPLTTPANPPRPPPRGGTTAEPVSDRRLTLASVVLVLGAMTTLLDTTIVNVALPHLHAVFHASVASTQWVASGYLLALAGVIPLSGWASERFGSRTVWMTAVGVFLVGSVLCGLAWSLPSLIGFRVLQGIGGGLVLPVSISILTQAAGPERLARALAAIMVPAQLAPILGPVVGGAIVDAVSWRWLFYVNVPLCLAALALAPRFLPDSPRSVHRLDVPGFLLLTPGLVSLAYGISEAADAGGFTATRVWGPVTAGVVLVAGFAVYATRAVRPLIDVRLFTRRNFGLASVITLAAGFSSYAAMFLLPQYFQVARGDSALHTGLLLIPQGLGTITFVLLRKVVRRVDTRYVVAGGIALTMIGILPFALAATAGATVLLLAGVFLQGLGVGAVLFPIATLAFTGLARPEMPRASAGFSVVQRVGAPFGVTVVAILLQRSLAHAAAHGTAITAAFGPTFWWVLAFSAVPLALAFLLPSLDRTPASTPAAQVVPTAQPAPERRPASAVLRTYRQSQGWEADE